MRNQFHRYPRKKFVKTLMKNWQIWLITLIMALTLIARGLASVARFTGNEPAASAQPVTTVPAD